MISVHSLRVGKARRWSVIGKEGCQRGKSSYRDIRNDLFFFFFKFFFYRTPTCDDSQGVPVCFYEATSDDTRMALRFATDSKR